MRKTKNSDSEKLDDTNLSAVIKLLEQEKPITKKAACDMLCISYNTTRLNKLIEAFKERKAKEAERRAALRGKPATPSEIQFIISEYLEGVSVDAISTSTCRGIQFIKTVLEENHVPIRAKAYDYFKPELVPEGAMRDRFALGEVVYSARYDSTAKIVSEQKTKEYGWIYNIWLLAEKWKQYAYQPAYELASLEHLVKLGVRL